MADILDASFPANNDLASVWPEAIRETRAALNQLAETLTPPQGFEDPLVQLPIDATSGDRIVDLNGYTEVLLVKTDASSHKITPVDTSGKSVCGGNLYPLSIKDEAIRLVLIGEDWKKIA